MGKLWKISAVLLLAAAIWNFAHDEIAVANQECIMAFLAQILAKMEE